jgi:predicted DNA-binding transcriptional regulator AlpA
MDAMITFAFERINQQLSEMAERIKQLESKCAQLEKQRGQSASVPQAPSNDELINVTVAKTILNVSRNTFLTMVTKGMFTPIRLNLRTVRYSRAEVQQFIDRKRGLIPAA